MKAETNGDGDLTVKVHVVGMSLSTAAAYCETTSPYHQSNDFLGPAQHTALQARLQLPCDVALEPLVQAGDYHDSTADPEMENNNNLRPFTAGSGIPHDAC